MKYLFMLFNEDVASHYTPEEMKPWDDFHTEAGKIATWIAGNALLPSTTATVVAVRDEKRVITDGPFADTKEQIGGFCIYDCADHDIAVRVAALIPWATTGHVEVRPILEISHRENER